MLYRNIIMFGSFLIFVLLSYPSAILAQEKHCLDGLSRQLRNAILTANNSVISKEGLVYPRGTYWQDDSGNYVGCPCNVTRCIRKCPEDYFTNDLPSSSNEDNPDVEPFVIPVWHKGQEIKVNAHEHFAVISSKMCEKEMATLLEPSYPEDEFRILSNGSIHYLFDNKTFGAEHFCLHINKNSSELEALICLPPDPITPKKEFQHYLYPVFLLISVFFLALTLLAYALAPEMRNLHGRSVASHSASLLIGFLGLALIQITGDLIRDEICYPIAFITYYFLLASFFWLNVMCFDIWWTFFGGFRKMMFLNESKRKKFLAYCVYAWTMPSIFFTITLCLQLIPSGIPEDMKPGIGKITCWFQNDVSTFFYFNGPISVILVMNLYFFISTALKILKVKRETAILKRGDSRMHSSNENAENNQRFKLYLKLFLVMGLSWTMEIISWLVGGPEEYWYFTDIINTLQGFLIFIICVWTTKTRDSLIRRVLPARFANRFTPHTTQSGAVTKTSEASESSVSHPSQGYKMKTMQDKAYE